MERVRAPPKRVSVGTCASWWQVYGQSEKEQPPAKLFAGQVLRTTIKSFFFRTRRCIGGGDVARQLKNQKMFAFWLIVIYCGSTKMSPERQLTARVYARRNT